MNKPNLRLVTPIEPTPELAPAECDQLAPEPYVADWMIEEGERAFRDRRAARRYRWAIRLVIAAAFANAAWALAKAL